MDRWFQLYPDIQGIFFDEQASAAEEVGYYLKAAGHVRRTKADALVVTNPGTVCSEEYLSRSASDMVCLTESRGELDGRLPAWTNRQGPKRLAALFYRVASTDQMHRAIGEIMHKGWDRLPHRRGPTQPLEPLAVVVGRRVGRRAAGEPGVRMNHLSWKAPPLKCWPIRRNTRGLRYNRPHPRRRTRRLDELDRADPLDHLEAELVLNAQPQRRTMDLVERLVIHLVGQQTVRRESGS